MGKRFRMSTALDVDDLLMECIPYAIRLANEKYKFDPPISIYEVDRWGTLNTRADVIFEFFEDPEFYKNQPVIKGAREFVQKLTKMTDVFISTSIPPKYMGIRAQRIMEEFPEIPPEHIYMGSRKDKLDVDMLHIGYILLLDTLDEEDSEYGTKMAKLLHNAQAHGIKTSIDVVSEAGERFKKLVCPAMRYTDYCIINEVEAQATTGVELRTEDGKLLKENMPAALKKMKEMGVSTWAVIHCPEIGCGLDENDDLVEVPSLKLPAGWIAGTVGAGDAFCSGVLYGAWKGMDLKSAIELGTASAACSLSQPGATEGMRTAQEAMQVYNDLR